MKEIKTNKKQSTKSQQRNKKSKIVDNDEMNVGKQNNTPSSNLDEDDTREYASRDYWESRYARKHSTSKGKQIDDETDEWCFDYAALAPILDSFRKTLSDQENLVIDMGCGISTLLFDMRNDGWNCQLLGLDYANEAVQIMREKYGKMSIQFKQCDLLQLSKQIDDESVDMFIDKMTLDAILHAEDGEQHVTTILTQVARCLQYGGTFVLVSQMTLQDNLDFFQGVILESLQTVPANWNIAEHISQESPLHVFTFTKLSQHSMSLRRARGPIVQIKTHEYD